MKFIDVLKENKNFDQDFKQIFLIGSKDNTVYTTIKGEMSEPDLLLILIDFLANLEQDKYFLNSIDIFYMLVEKIKREGKTMRDIQRWLKNDSED